MVSDYSDAGQVQWLEDTGIDLFRGDGRIAGPGRVSVNGAELVTEHVVLATGSDPVDTCEAAVPAAQAAGYDPGDLRVRVRDVKVSGDEATARCDLGGSFALVRTEAGWRVSAPACID